MSDYGLLSRKLTLDVEYEDTPFTLAHAKVPVFAVGREQLYQLFGLQGYECPRPDNFYCSLEYSDLEHASYALVCLGGEWSNSYVTLRRMVCLCDVYDSFEQASMHTGLALELDAEKALMNPHCYPIYQYEVWQICDDDSLWHDWDLAADLYWNDECYDNWLAEISDGPHYYPTIVKKSALMSEDYLSSLKTYNAHHLESLRQLREAGELTPDHECSVSDIVKLERCANCGVKLEKPYKYYVDDWGLLCRDCWRDYQFDLEAADADRPRDAIKEEGFVWIEGEGFC